MNDLKKIREALLCLAECVDALENIDPVVARNRHFRTRKKLIEDILDK